MRWMSAPRPVRVGRPHPDAVVRVNVSVRVGTAARGADRYVGEVTVSDPARTTARHS